MSKLFLSIRFYKVIKTFRGGGGQKLRSVKCLIISSPIKFQKFPKLFRVNFYGEKMRDQRVFSNICRKFFMVKNHPGYFPVDSVMALKHTHHMSRILKNIGLDADPNGLFENPNLPTRTFTADDLSFICKDLLTEKHYTNPHVLAFISSYIMCRDVSQASKAAGIHGNQGYGLLRQRDVYEVITKATTSMFFKHGVDPQELVQKVKEITEVDPADIFNPDGTCIENMNDIAPETRRAIKKFKVKNLYEYDVNGVKTIVGKLVEVEMWDKIRSAELLGREVGKFKETKVIEHEVTANMKDTLLAARDRAEAMATKTITAIDVTPQPGVIQSSFTPLTPNRVKREFPKP